MLTFNWSKAKFHFTFTGQRKKKEGNWTAKQPWADGRALGGEVLKKRCCSSRPPPTATCGLLTGPEQLPSLCSPEWASPDPWPHHRGLPGHLPLSGGPHVEDQVWRCPLVQSWDGQCHQTSLVGKDVLPHPGGDCGRRWPSAHHQVL